MKNTPCKECPFRKKSLKGYLGPHDDAKEIVALLTVGLKFPCHMEVNSIAAKRHAGNHADEEAVHCIGALQMSRGYG